MSYFDLKRSMADAEKRFKAPPTSRRERQRRRSDRGRSRLLPSVRKAVDLALAGHERPAIKDILAQVDERCRAAGNATPSRATIYSLLAKSPGPGYAVATLPPHVRETLYNLDDAEIVPGHQLAFCCFNYGGLGALSFAAGLPWLPLYQAARQRGWRPKSLGLLRAVMRARHI